MEGDVGRALSDRVAKQAERRARAERRREEADRRAHEAALRTRRKVRVEETPEGRRVTITARSEMRSVGLFLALALLCVAGIIAAADLSAGGPTTMLTPWFLWSAGGAAAWAAVCAYPWRLHVLLTPQGYAVYRWSPRLAFRVGPTSELWIRNAYHYGHRMRIGVERGWGIEFWGIDNPKDRALIESLGRRR